MKCGKATITYAMSNGMEQKLEQNTINAIQNSSWDKESLMESVNRNWYSDSTMSATNVTGMTELTARIEMVDQFGDISFIDINRNAKPLKGITESRTRKPVAKKHEMYSMKELYKVLSEAKQAVMYDTETRAIYVDRYLDSQLAVKKESCLTPFEKKSVVGYVVSEKNKDYSYSAKYVKRANYKK